MRWKPSPIIKIYEALGSIGDERVEINGDTAKVYSSSGNKYYDVLYDKEQNAITANDNGSYWVGYLGYPSIVFLFAKGIVSYDEKLSHYLKGFAWKDINTKFKNDFAKTQEYIDNQISERHSVDINEFHQELEALLEKVNNLKLEKLTTSAKPPTAY